MDFKIFGQLIQLTQEHGLSIVLTLFIGAVLWLFVKFFFAQWKTMQEREKALIELMQNERVASQTVLTGYLKNYENHSTETADANSRMNQAHNYQREEHMKIIELSNSLIANTKVMQEELKGAIGKFVDAHSFRGKEHEAIILGQREACNTLVECTKTLAIINGKVQSSL